MDSFGAGKGPEKIGGEFGTEFVTKFVPVSRENESIYLHRTSPLLENGLDRPENRYGRYGFASFSGISISTIGVAGA